MPRIAFITSTFPDYEKCNHGIYAGALVHALASQNHDVHVFTSAIPEIRPSWGKVTIHKIMRSWNPMDIPRLTQAFLQVRPEIIHINHPTAIAAQPTKFLVTLIPELNRTFWRRPLVTTLHDVEGGSVVRKMKLAPFLMESDALTVANEFSRRRLEKLLPQALRQKIHVVPPGARVPEKTAVDPVEQRRRWDLNPDDKVIGFVGFIEPSKGLHTLIEALAPLLRRDPRLKLLALSSWGHASPVYRQKIIARLGREGLLNQVVFTGCLESKDFEATLSTIDVCVFPADHSVEEKISSSLRQALVCGRPVIACARDCSYSEFGLRHGENIWLSPHKNTEALQKDIAKLINDEPLRRKISEATTRLQLEWSFDAVSNSMSRIYSKIF